MVLVSHDGERWLPTVLEGLAGQLAPVAHCVAVDTGSKDASADLLADAFGADRVVALPASTGFPAALNAGLAHLDELGADTEWVWVLHDDASPHPEALAGPAGRRGRRPGGRRARPDAARVAVAEAAARARRHDLRDRPARDRAGARRVRPGPVLRAAPRPGRQHRRHAGTPTGPRRARRARRRAADLRQRPRLRLARRRGRPQDRRGAAGRRLPRRGGTPRAAAYGADRPPHPLPGAACRAVHPARELPVPGLAADRRCGWRSARSSGCWASWRSGRPAPALDDLAAYISVCGAPG